jgi:hypothetical protein
MHTTAEKIYETAKQLTDGLALEALHYIDNEVWNDAKTR